MRDRLRFEQEIASLDLFFGWPFLGLANQTALVIAIDKIKINGFPEILLRQTKTSVYEGFVSKPFHVRAEPSYIRTVEVSGRIQVETSGTKRKYDPKVDSKAWPMRKAQSWVEAKVVSSDGPSSSTAEISKVQQDGFFKASTSIGLSGFCRKLDLYVVLELSDKRRITSKIAIELVDLDGFLGLVEPKEKARSSSQSHLEFLASVRKIYQGGPADPLSGLFDWVLYRNRHVKTLALPGATDYDRFMLYKGGLYAGGDWLDVSHVLTGIEGSPSQDPSKDQNLPAPSRPELLVTWAGDLGSALQAYIKEFWHAVDKGDPLDLKAFLVKRAGRADLLGDIDGINIGRDYDSSRSLSDNLRAYYNVKSRQRYKEFIKNSLDPDGSPELTLVPGARQPRLSQKARQAIAESTRLFLLYPHLQGKLYSGSDPSKRKLIDSIVQVDSVEMEQVVDYFAGFLEDGLAREA